MLSRLYLKMADDSSVKQCTCSGTYVETLIPTLCVCVCVCIRGECSKAGVYAVLMLVCQPPSALTLNGTALWMCNEAERTCYFQTRMALKTWYWFTRWRRGSFFAAENSAKREENGCNGNPYKIRSVRTKRTAPRCRDGAGNICCRLPNLHLIMVVPRTFA